MSVQDTLTTEFLPDMGQMMGSNHLFFTEFPYFVFAWNSVCRWNPTGEIFVKSHLWWINFANRHYKIVLSWQFSARESFLSVRKTQSTSVMHFSTFLCVLHCQTCRFDSALWKIIPLLLDEGEKVEIFQWTKNEVWVSQKNSIFSPNEAKLGLFFTVSETPYNFLIKVPYFESSCLLRQRSPCILKIKRILALSQQFIQKESMVKI